VGAFGKPGGEALTGLNRRPGWGDAAQVEAERASLGAQRR